MKEVAIFDFEPFPFKFGFCDSDKAWKKFAKEVGIEDNRYIPAGDACCVQFETTNGYAAVVCVNGKRQKSERTKSCTIGLLAHECSHAFDFLCESIGEKFPSGEFKAYTTQCFVQYCYDCLYGED